MLANMYLLCRRGGMRIHVSSEVPLGAGLGSSGSFCVALAGATLHLAKQLASEQGRGLSLLACTCLENKSSASSSSSSATSHASSMSFCPCMRERINAWAFEGERVLHGNPSGVDNTVSVHGTTSALLVAAMY